MKTISQIWRYLVSFGDAPTRPGKHIRSLEAEVIRQSDEIACLRAENRALLNSILGIAGIPPLPVTPFTPLSPAVGHSESPTHSRAADESLLRPPHLLQTAPTSDSSSRQSGTRNDSPLSPSPESATQPSAPTKPRSLAALPTRRRSWHQINRMLEIESARKPVTSD